MIGVRIALIAALACLAAACVTRTETVFTEEPAPEKALERRVSLARQYIGEGNWEDAKRNLALAAEIDPDNAGVHEAFALVYQSTGEYELAEENFKRALRLDKDFSRARNNYAAFLFSRSRYREAEQQLQYVVADSLYEARPQAFVNLGLCRLQLFDPEGAEEAFARSLTMERNNPIALLELAILRYDAGDFDTADGYYTRYRGLLRQQSARGLWLGLRLARARGDLDAEGSYALALRNLYPDSPEYQAYRRSQQDG